MNERKITEEVLAELRKLRGAVVLKHADRFTKGVPDLSVSVLGGTSWIELKYLRKKARLRDVVDTLQLTLCHELATTTNGRCWVVVFEEEPRRVTVWQPQALFRHLWPRVAGPNPANPKWKHLGCAPVEIENLEYGASLAGTLHAYGAFRVPGWPYDVVTKLVQSAVR